MQSNKNQQSRNFPGGDFVYADFSKTNSTTVGDARISKKNSERKAEMALSDDGLSSNSSRFNVNEYMKSEKQN